MSRRSRHVQVAAIILLVSLLVVLNVLVEKGQTQGPPVKDVTVVNTPLPVKLGMTSDVKVVNDQTNPVPVVVQGENGDAPQSVEFLVEALNSDPPTTIFTVPTGKRLTITDVIVTVSSGGFHFIYRNGTVVSKPRPGSIGTYSHTYRTGIEFVEGDILAVDADSFTDPSFFELRGILTDL